jgi:phage-related protein
VAATQIFYFQEEDATVPMVRWLDELQSKARQKCLARLERLEAMGHELRRPEADYLRDNIYELRASHQGVHYRMLYFFHATAAIIVSHGLIKEREVPPREIDLAIRRKGQFEASPKRHAYRPKR